MAFNCKLARYLICALVSIFNVYIMKIIFYTVGYLSQRRLGTLKLGAVSVHTGSSHLVMTQQKGNVRHSEQLDSIGF